MWLEIIELDDIAEFKNDNKLVMEQKSDKNDDKKKNDA